MLKKREELKDAIKSKLGKHLEISIKVEPAKEEIEEESMSEEKPDESKGEEIEVPELEDDSTEEHPFLRGYSEADKEALLKRKPHSLRERVIQGELTKGKKKEG